MNITGSEANMMNCDVSVTLNGHILMVVLPLVIHYLRPLQSVFSIHTQSHALVLLISFTWPHIPRDSTLTPTQWRKLMARTKVKSKILAQGHYVALCHILLYSDLTTKYHVIISK